MVDRSGGGDADRRARWEKSALRVFISHDTEEAGAAAIRLADDLELLGCAVWLAPRDIAPGDKWSSRLQEAIRQSTHVIALLVTKPIGGWVEYELNVALDLSMKQKLTLVPVIGQPEAALPPLLTGFQAVDISRGYSAGLRELSRVLQVGEALATAESAIVERWEAGWVQLNRHRQLLRQQLSNLRGVLDAEQRRLDSCRTRAEDGRQEAAAGEAEAAALRAQAQQSTERARELSEAAAKAAAEVDDRDARVAGLKVRLSELHAEHDPMLDLIDQAHQFLERVRRMSPLEMARDQDVVTLLERPETVVASMDGAAASRSPRGYAHRHRIAGALIAAVDRSLLTGSAYKAVLARGLEAMDVEFPDGVELPPGWDDAHLKDLENSLARAVQRHAEQPDADSSLGLSQALQLAFVSYASGLEYPPRRVTPVVKPGSPRGDDTTATIGAPVDITDCVDVVLTGVRPEWETSSDLLVERIQLVTATSPQPTDVSGFFDARRLVRSGPFPAVVARGMDRRTAVRAKSMLTASGAHVELQSSGDPTPSD